MLAVCALPATAGASGSRPKLDYGVFIGDTKVTAAMFKYRTVVVDAQYLSATDIGRLHNNGRTVLTYLNIGSLEKFRSYYSRFSSITLGAYEGWPEERWIDVSKTSWKSFIVDLGKKLLRKKNVDGFFIDNTDVYYRFHKDRIYNGLLSICSSLRKTGAQVIINGGDEFVSRAIRSGRTRGCFTGVNQESVYTALGDDGSFAKASPKDRKYFTAYLDRVRKSKLTVYVVEYSADPALNAEIEKYSKKHGWHCYISPKLELT